MKKYESLYSHNVKNLNISRVKTLYREDKILRNVHFKRRDTRFSIILLFIDT